MYDITIVGAGPAGSTLARLIGKKYNVLVLDKRNLIDNKKENSFEKCCGGLLAPDAQNMLAKFGLGVPKEVLVGPQLFTVRTIDMQNSIERYYQRHYINVDREKFDKWLVSIIPSSVTIQCGCLFKSYKEEGNKIKVTYLKDGKTYSEYTKILVGADGANSRLRSQAIPFDIEPKTYISIQEWFKINKNQPFFSAIFDNEISDFYSWTIPKEDNLILGAALDPNDNPHKKFQLLKRKLSKYGFEFKDSVKKNGALLLRPEKLKQICIGKKNVALIGEAAGWISPSSAEGLSYAFRSALALSDALINNPEKFLEEYYNNSMKLRKNIKGKLLKSPCMYNSTIRKTILKTGILSMKIYK